MTPPVQPQAIAFFDGQNLFHAVKQNFGYTFPNYDLIKLATSVCHLRGWNLVATRFYTGVPAAADDPRWHRFWTAKLGSLGKQGVFVYGRQLRYRTKSVNLPNGSVHQFRAGEEK